MSLTAPPRPGPKHLAPRPPAPQRAGRWAKRHKVLSALLAVVVLLTPVWWSLGSALGDPGMGTSVPARLAEWFRGHGGSWIVTQAESLWYSHHQPPVGGKPPKGAIPAGTAATAVPHGSRAPHLPPPSPIAPIASPAVSGEGQWHPAGRLVRGLPAVYETYLRPDTVHTSVVVGVAWMDTELLSARLYSGSTIPGSGPWQLTAPVSSSAASSLVAAFNSGFLMKNANGGYYSEGRTPFPLRNGAASLVIYRDGTATVGQWGRDVNMSSTVMAVRQNLDLLVDDGRPVPGLLANDTSKWGYTLGNKVYVWRSGVGVTADGALVYAGGPDMNITSLADVLVHAGAVRAMELDINTDWVNFASFAPTTGGAASATNGTELLQNMAGSPSRYFANWWTRDFVTMSAR